MEKYKRIYKDLYYKIKTGEIPSGTKLPTEEQLAAQYGVSKITAKAALNLLQKDGLVIRKKRLGTLVLNDVVNALGEKLIAIVFSGFDHLDTRFINGLKQLAAPMGVKLAFFDSKISPEKEREILLFLLSENIAGLILMPTSQDHNLDVISAFEVQKIPVVYMDFPLLGSIAPTVTSDNFGASYDLVKYLLEMGHREIGFFPYSDSFIPTERDRFRGYCRALIENGIPINADYLFPISARCMYTMISSVSAMDMTGAEEFFARYESLDRKPTAIVCINDLSAYAVITVARKRGLSVPEDLSVTGFDNLTVATKWDITTVAQNFTEIAKNALQVLIRRMEGSTVELPTVKIKTVLIRRESVSRISSPDDSE